MYQIILLVHMIVSLMLVGLVLIQQGKGAEMGASFGSGASSTIFGSQGTGGFLFRLTAGLALTFFMTSLALSSIVFNQHKNAQELILPVDSKAINDTMRMPEESSSKSSQ